MKQFTDLGLAEPILRAVTAEGYSQPTPIQADAIPVLLEGRDLVGIAQTGTGKTAAFVLPLLHRMLENRRRPAAKSAGALILAPTRELAAQIADSIRTYGRHAGLSVTVVVGGVKPGPQVRALARGVDFLVATPGRLLDHMGTGAVRLDATTAVVLDEADQMLDLGFMPAIRKIMGRLPKQRQTLLFSATMPAPIRSLASDFLTDPAEVAVTPAARPIDRIDQSVIHVDRAAKRGVLVELLGRDGVERAIVFTRTKRGADKVSRHLEQAGLSSAAIHGDKSQGQRERALDAFRSGNVTILVATDIAARGIDVDGVSHVVNYELPNVPESYVHRIGRTARAGASGVAYTLCDGEERGLLRDIERLVGAPIGTGGIQVSAPLVAPPSDQPAERNSNGNRRRPNGGRPRREQGGNRPQGNGNRADAKKAGPARPKRRRKQRPATGTGDAAGLSRMLGNIG